MRKRRRDSRSPVGQHGGQKFGMRFRSKVTLALLALVLVSNGLLLWLTFRGSSALLFQEIQSKVLSIAITAAVFMDGDRHERLHTQLDAASPG